MFYVLLPIGNGSVRFFHCLTRDLQAEVEKLAFRLGKTSTFGVFTKSETNWIWHVFIPWTSNDTVGRFLFVTATFRVLPRTFADLGCLSYNASTTWRHIVRPKCPRSLCFKTMWCGKKIFNDCQDLSRVWVLATLETPRKILGPTHPIITGVASSMCPRAKEMQLRSIHHVCKLIER